MHNKTRSIARQISSFSKKKISELFKRSKYILRLPELDIRFSKTDSEFGKVLIVTPKRIGNAPERNSIKRKIKALFYQDKIYNHGYDFIFLCKPGSVNFSFENLRKIFIKIFKKLEAKKNAD